MNYRKIRKLLLTPKRFFQDALLNINDKKLMAGNSEKVIAIGISTWKRDVFSEYIQNKNILYFGTKTESDKIIDRVKRHKIKKIYVWGNFIATDVASIPNVKIIKVEDGFIRSVGLGAEHIPPLSLCFDDMGIYYDARKTSRLEQLIKNHKLSNSEISSSKKIIEKVIKNNISKYNLPNTSKIKNLNQFNQNKILVIGQVETDQSIIYGCSTIIDNEKLLQLAINENPDSMVFYRPHPDVQKGLREKTSHPEKNISKAIILDQPNIDINWLLDNVDHVYTITSLTGFEALLRGKKVTTLGSPFYSGWGLTDDRDINLRRNIERSIESLFYCAYVLYPKYLIPGIKEKTDISKVINEIISLRKKTQKNTKTSDYILALKQNRISIVSEETTTLTQNNKPKSGTTTIHSPSKVITFGDFNKLIKYGATEEAISVARDLWRNAPWSNISIKAYYSLFGKQGRLKEQQQMIKIGSEKRPNDHELQVLFCKNLRSLGIYDEQIITKLENVLTQSPSYFPARYFLCEYLWETQGICKLLLKHLGILQLDLDKISNQAKLFICACYCELGHYSKALSIYKKYNNEFTDLKNYFLLEAVKEAKYGKDFEKLNYINLVYKTQEDFKNKILNCSSYAVVGNAPTEIGKQSGISIDAREIVIRFNNYNTDIEYSPDYGSKTNIWVKSGFYQDIERRYTENYEMVIQSGINPMFRNSAFEDFSLDFKTLNIPFTVIPPQYYYELIRELRASPSAGLCILFWIYKISGKIPRANIFGFSLGNQEKNASEHYFKNSKSQGFYPHDWEKEALILNKIIIW